MALHSQPMHAQCVGLPSFESWYLYCSAPDHIKESEVCIDVLQNHQKSMLYKYYKFL